LAARVGFLRLGGLHFACALGRNGCRAMKREGDGATPVGAFRLCQVLYRADRERRPATRLPVARLDKDAGWCDAPADRNYNRPVRLPYAARAERLWRADQLYDLLVVLDHNACPRVRHRGSAIFLHVATSGLTPTEGCVALARAHLLRLLGHLGRGATISICGAPRPARLTAACAHPRYRRQ
jgi:L,D-peptidoglycan transpeptidase YkuD (ErfK/YbiS/YcfS/YnhG family)